jgi:hypothetical protein
MKLAVAVTSTQKEMKMSSIPKTDNENLADLQKRADNIQQQINLENEWTEFLRNLVYYGFLEMVIDDDDNIGGH